MNRRFLFSTSISLGLLLNVAPAFAQAAAPADAPADAGPAPEPATAAPAAPTPAPAAPVADAPPPAPPAPAPGFSGFKIEPSPGNSLKVGLLVQPTFRAAGSAALAGTDMNLFVRRTRLLVGGTAFGVIDYFFDTDAPNLGLSANEAGAMGPPIPQQKGGAGMFVQDAFAGIKVAGDAFKVDAGYMLPPMSHNSVQGAGTLYGLDYFSYSFVHTNSFNMATPPVGRDVGVQLRGLVLDNHLEYRAGLFQGLRRPQNSATDLGSQNMFRFTARVQANFLDAETGFFYGGTYLGKKSIASIGASLDIQDKYKYFSGDGFLDLPVGPGVITAQVDVAHYDGGTFIPGLIKQTDIMGEAGFMFDPLKIGPIVRVEHRSGSGALVDQTKISGGVAWFGYGHNSNLKAFFSNTKDKGATKGANQFDLQWQVYLF